MQRLGGNVDDLHLIGLTQEEIGNCFGLRNTSDFFDNIMNGFEVLDVNGRNYIDTRRQNLLDILPTFLISRSSDIGVGELIDQDNLRFASQDGI